jgi:aldehyde:ferredoxin oxidoreductase
MLGGYVGNILRVDLTTGAVSKLNTMNYVPQFIGGIGLGYRLLWDEVKQGTTEWSPENALIFTSGPCCGTPVPTSGRAEVVGLAPQGYPVPWAAVSGFGGDFGPKMKFAGYDAIIITGKTTSPKYLLVSEKEIQLVDANFLWGLDIYTAQDALLSRHGDDVAIACIGPAGENRVRWATIMSKTRSAAGQGGFGAVMGDKKLKAIVVKPGSVRVPIAHPEKLIEEVKKVSGELSPKGQNRTTLFTDRGRYSIRCASCAYSGCTGGVNMCLQPFYNDVPLKHTGTGNLSGGLFCAGSAADYFLLKKGATPEENFEMGKIIDQLGLNCWEIFEGTNWFIQNCQNDGKLPTLMGETVVLNKKGPAVYPKTDWNSEMPADLAVKWIKGITFREGEGDIWAEGTPRAAEMMGLSNEVWKTHKHGYGPHWDGRYVQFSHYPVWVYSALAWATQGRDPFNQEHGYPERYASFVKEWRENMGGVISTPTKSLWDTEKIPYREMCKAGAKIYGARYANEGWDKPELGYVDKEYVAFWHNHRAIIKSSVPVCDRQFPLLYDPRKEDKIGDLDAEVRLFNAVVGTDWSLDEMNKAAEKVFNVMRSIHIRQGRTRKHDESVIPYFEQPAMWPDEPGPQTIDVNKFLDLLNRFYRLRGWDTNGCPTRAKLEALGLEDIADGLKI